MRKFQVGLFGAILAFGLCGVGRGGEVQNAHPSSDSLRCPSSNFKDFLASYTEDSQVQRKFTKFPLRMQHLDVRAQPEPKPVVQILAKGQVKFPLIQRASDRQSLSLVIEINEIEDRQAKITLKKVDTDYQVNYFFSRNGCWKLDRIEDWSM